MNRKILPCLLTLVLAIMACNIQSLALPPTIAITSVSTNTVQPATPTVPVAAAPTNTALLPTPIFTTAPATSSPGGLTVEMLRNGTYHTPFYDRTVTLVNGTHTEGSDANVFSVRMLDVVAFGDLNGDGKEDAAIILAENGGGTGNFESLVAVINHNGTPYQQDQVEIGDREHVNSMDISSGVVHMDMIAHGPNDPMCCPAVPQKRNYWLIDNHLWLMRLTSTIGGVDHVINVDSPGIWTTVGNPFTVKGSVTVLPFENTLAYRIYLTDGTKVNESNLTVTPSSGTAAMFTRDFNLSSAGITDWVIIQFVDVSAADGSTIALGSVILKAQ